MKRFLAVVGLALALAVPAVAGGYDEPIPVVPVKLNQAALANPLPYVEGQIIVKTRPGTGLTASGHGSTLVHRFDSGAELWRLPAGVTVENALSSFSVNNNVIYAEPDYIVSADVTPNDPLFGNLYGMVKVQAPQAWDLFTGSLGVKVGVIDTGIDWTHSDLAPNIWTNPNEIPGNEIDDDNNGCIDDVHGCNFIYRPSSPHGDAQDDYFHGTHVAGTIAAAGNNSVGVAGVNWRATLVAIKVLDCRGSGSSSGVAAGIEYATRIGVAVTNNSYGSGGASQAMSDAITNANAAGIGFVCSAGNSARNNDVTPQYPASFTQPNVITVASSDQNDARSSFSNWGPISVDLAAPGSNVYSTYTTTPCGAPNGPTTYASLSGTSMSSPHVAGAYALLKGHRPALTDPQIKAAILESVDLIPAWNGLTVTGGRLNVFRALTHGTSAACNDGLCEMPESCVDCSNDCPSRRTGKPNRRFCCGDGTRQSAETSALCDGNF